MEGPRPPATSPPRSGQSGKTRLISCSTCQQRKVKCDKAQPTCSNCAKHRTSCVYIPPALPIRKKRKSPEEQLVGRLRRYERLLRAHNIPTDDDQDHASTSIEKGSISETLTTSIVTERVSSLKKQDGTNHNHFKPSGNFVVDAGKQSFIESPLWNILSDELQGPVDMRRLSQPNCRESHQVLNGGASEGLFNAGDFLLSNAATHSAAELKAMHPRPLIIFRLWQVFLDNINPLTKLLHAPTV